MSFLDTFDSYREMINIKMDSDLHILKNVAAWDAERDD